MVNILTSSPRLCTSRRHQQGTRNNMNKAAKALTSRTGTRCVIFCTQFELKAEKFILICVINPSRNHEHRNRTHAHISPQPARGNQIIWRRFNAPCAEYIMCVNVVGEVTHSPRPGVLSSLCPRGEETSLAINFAFKRQVRPGGRGGGGREQWQLFGHTFSHCDEQQGVR